MPLDSKLGTNKMRSNNRSYVTNPSNTKYDRTTDMQTFKVKPW